MSSHSRTFYAIFKSLTSGDSLRQYNERHQISRVRTEDKGGVARDARLGLLAIRHRRRDGDQPLTAGLHASDTDIPALDDLALAQTELELQ